MPRQSLDGWRTHIRFSVTTLLLARQATTAARTGLRPRREWLGRNGGLERPPGSLVYAHRLPLPQALQLVVLAAA